MTDIMEERELIIFGILAITGILIIGWVVLEWEFPDLEQYPDEYDQVSIPNDKIKTLECIEDNITDTNERIGEKDRMIENMNNDISNTNSTIITINNINRDYSMIAGITIGYILGIIISFPLVRRHINKKLEDEGY